MDKPDARQACLCIIESGKGIVRAKTIDDHHAIVASYPLAPSVPKDIQIAWNTAQNLWLYAWHVWRFYPIAEMQALAVLEMSLRIRLERDAVPAPQGLKKLMTAAIKRGLLVDEHMEEYREMQERRLECAKTEEKMAQEFGWPKPPPEPPVPPQAYCRYLVELLRNLRNHYAHGSSSLHFSIAPTFHLCRDLINQLYR